MKQTFRTAWLLLLPVCLIITCFDSGEAKSNESSTGIILVASTPCDEEIKSILEISADTKIDFIRWELSLSNNDSENHTFLLNINYGESQPNTLGFIKGGEKMSIHGSYSSSNGTANAKSYVYHLKSSQLNGELLIAKLNSNLWHLLTSRGDLMKGNGGWSYTLNRKNVVPDSSFEFPVHSMPATDSRPQIIFEGRTPCTKIAKDKNLDVTPDCFKIKWKIILDRDPDTGEPTTYTLTRTGHRQSETTGKWSIKNGIPSNPHVNVYSLDPQVPGKSISFVLGDENVAFFLDNNNAPFIGNNNFSYTLNRRQ